MRIVRLVAAASLSALFLTGSVGVAEALKKGQSPQSCEAKHDACEVRCWKRYPGNVTQIAACQQRTCDRQRENCRKGTTAQ